jgi:sugar lactone lactonase YvrE
MAQSGRAARWPGWAVAVGLLVAAALPAPVAAEQRSFGDARILAQVPAPGLPEGIAVWANKVYVAGPAGFGTAGTGPSHVWAFNRSTGAVARSWQTQGENLALEHANSGVAVDRIGRVYVLNIQIGMFRILHNGTQEQYSSPFPDLPICSALPPGTPCAPMPFDAPALPNDVAFDDAGNAYVTDSLQATIWRVPPGGGDPEIWFQDIRLATTFVGVNGIKISPDGSAVYVSVTVDLTGRAWIYRLPLVAQPSAAGLVPFHEYTGGDLPDGFAFGETGLLYVAIATPFASGVSILDQSGAEIDRLANGSNPLSPYDSPANIAFDGKGSMLLSNHAFATGPTNPDQYAVLDVFVDDRGAPLARPKLP